MEIESLARLNLRLFNVNPFHNLGYRESSLFGGASEDVWDVIVWSGNLSVKAPIDYETRLLKAMIAEKLGDKHENVMMSQSPSLQLLGP